MAKKAQGPETTVMRARNKVDVWGNIKGTFRNVENVVMVGSKDSRGLPMWLSGK